MNEVDGIRRIRFTSPHPHDFTPDVIDAMAGSGKVCEHIHFPLQSGSDRVLKAMQRSYRRERYLGWLERIRTAIPDIAVAMVHAFPRLKLSGLYSSFCAKAFSGVNCSPVPAAPPARRCVGGCVSGAMWRCCRGCMLCCCA